MRRATCGLVSALAVVTLAGCGDRSESDAAHQFINAFNEGTLSESNDIFYPRASRSQIERLDALRETCKIAVDSVSIVDGFISADRKILGAIATCDGEDFSVITNIDVECETADCESSDFRVNPDPLPGGKNVGKLSNEDLPQKITSLEPWT